MTYALEDGLECYAYQYSDVISRTHRSRCVLWLDINSDEPGLSRLCVVSKEVFDRMVKPYLSAGVDENDDGPSSAPFVADIMTQGHYCSAPLGEPRAHPGLL